VLESVVGSFVLVAASERGDKTQLLAFSLASRFRKPWVVIAGVLVATLANHALAARYHSISLVTVGTTLDMMAANGPAVFLGEKLAGRLRPWEGCPPAGPRLTRSPHAIAPPGLRDSALLS
jgi:putative Ca2+/H+ antiporter (TMEM165/GDT1 family)